MRHKQWRFLGRHFHKNLVAKIKNFLSKPIFVYVSYIVCSFILSTFLMLLKKNIVTPLVFSLIYILFPRYFQYIMYINSLKRIYNTHTFMMTDEHVI